MAEKTDKFADIKELLDFFEKKWSEISAAQIKNFKAMELKAAEEVAEAEKRNKIYITEKVLEMQAEGTLATSEEAAQYARKMMEEQQKRKLESEIDILKEISKEEEAKRARQTKILEKEKELQKTKNKGDDKNAKIVQKELDKLKREEAISKKKEKQLDREKQLKEEGQSYEFGDALKEMLQPLSDEMATGNALARSADKALSQSLKSMGKAINDSVNAINNAISSYAKYQTAINARLQGSQGDAVNVFGNLVTKLDDVAFSPLISASDLYSNLSTLVGQGIVTNVEQRAFFATIKDGIATTFDVTSDSLNRIIRIQHTDSTAARLGMESYLTRFLNTYVENTEYLQSTFDSVANSLLEASAVLGSSGGAGASVEFEYVVQKWLGTLTGIGLSDTTAQSIATALGQLGSGNVDVLNTQMGTLLTMSASNIGENIGDILNKGLDADTTNKLLKSMVQYLQTIAGDGTNVTKAELSKVFGVSISDLVAVAQMDQDAINTINNDLLSYGGMYTELKRQFNQLPSRMGISNILENLFSNLTYQTGMSIASNPASYAMWKITDLIQGVTGGINIPAITAVGSGIDLNATVEQLMKLHLIGTNMLGNIGGIINGVKSIGKGDVLLSKLGVNASSGEFTTFGSGLNVSAGSPRTSGSQTSKLAYVGQEDSAAYSESTLNKSKTEANKELTKMTSEQEDPTTKLLNYLRTDVDLKAGIDNLNRSLTEKILPAISKGGSIDFSGSIVGTTVVAPMSSGENISVSNTVMTATTVSAPSPVIDYFESIKFEESLVSIVQNLIAINSKMPSGFGTGSSIAGITQ